MAKILVVDDDDMINQALCRAIDNMGHEPMSAFTIEESIEKMGSNNIDIVFLDVRLPDGNGLDALPRIRAARSKPEVIIITGFGNHDSAEMAIKCGAWDYIRKPCSMNEMTLPLIRALDYRNAKLEADTIKLLNREGIIGGSTRISDTLNLAAKAALGNTTVFLCGETGTGKELLARAIHENSSRSRHGFVIVDCTALPESLAESLLFGHEKGTFTGAYKKSRGLIAQADGGTLFLDEIGDLAPNVQKTFLRVIQDRHFRPVGASGMRKSDFRLVAATNRNLDQMVGKGLFRQDLLFRIRGFSIELPPLREHKEDIKDLLLHYLNELCESYGTATKGFTAEFLEALTVYDWPGNVREFVHALEEALVRAMNSPILYPKHLPTHIRVKVVQDELTEMDTPPNALCRFPASGLTEDEHFPNLKQIRNDFEKAYFHRLMSHVQGNRKKACRIAGISRTRLFDLLKKHGIS